MKKVLVSQLIKGQMSTTNDFSDRLASALSTNASGEDLLVYLSVGIPTKVSLKDDKVISEIIFSNNSNLKGVENIEINSIDLPNNKVNIEFTAKTTRYFKDEESAKDKDGNRYNGNSKRTEEYPYAKVISYQDTDRFDIDYLEEMGVIEVIRRH